MLHRQREQGSGSLRGRTRILQSDQNRYQERTSVGKLRGQYYTPEALVAMMLDRVPLAPDHLVVDPACGDGSFLKGAVAAVARQFSGSDRRELARHWSGRLIGFDVNGDAVAAARLRLREAFRCHLGVELEEAALQLHQADVLRYPHLPALLAVAGVPGMPHDERLLVIGNPPYVEAKRLCQEMKAALKARYPDAVGGAPDLYLYFLHVCLGWLRPSDTLAFVLPNKLLVNANAQAIRERLLEEGRLRGLWFATQASIFPDAAVYPVVLFAGGPRSVRQRCVETVRIVRADSGAIERSESAAIEADWYRRTAARAFFPPPETPVLRSALERLLEHRESARLEDALDIRWTVSFHRAGLREQYVLPERPEDLWAQPFLGGGSFSGNGEVTRYRLDWAGWWIRYEPSELQAKKNPLPDPSMFEAPKIVICQNGRTLRAAYDNQGFVLKDTFLCGSIRDAEHPLCRHPRALVGLLCSRAIHFFYSHVFYGGHVNGGYLHFLRSFLVDIPLGTWSEDGAQAVADLVRRREACSHEERTALEEQIEEHVAEALGLTAAEQEAIAEWAAGDANWQARERVRLPVSLKAENTKTRKGENAKGR